MVRVRVRSILKHNRQKKDFWFKNCFWLDGFFNITDKKKGGEILKHNTLHGGNLRNTTRPLILIVKHTSTLCLRCRECVLTMPHAPISPNTLHRIWLGVCIETTIPSWRATLQPSLFRVHGIFDDIRQRGLIHALIPPFPAITSKTTQDIRQAQKGWGVMGLLIGGER